MQRNANKSEKGITLIALVVTIVVLLILAGVSLSLVLGENGLINKSKEARDKYAEATQNEQSELDKVDEWIEENLGGSTGGGGSQNLPSTGETKPYLPGDDFSQVTGTDLSNGLVIEDGIGNQYVWIEVPRTETVYPTAGTAITAGSDGRFTTEQYATIEEDLHAYTDIYRNGTSYTDTWYSEETTGLTRDEYTQLKQTMLQSVYQNGGFWVGRYEAGIEINRTSYVTIDDSSALPISKENEYPYTYITCSEAQTLASKVNSGNYTSSLMFGVQWDLVLKYLEVKAVEKGEKLDTIQNELNLDSGKWGNYYDATFKLNRGKYAKIGVLNTWYDYTEDLTSCVIKSVKQSNSSSSNTILLTTGASDATSKQNIYDLAGNVWEWSLEYTSDPSRPCTIRGGCYTSAKSDPASKRSRSMSPTSSGAGSRLPHFTLLVV